MSGNIPTPVNFDALAVGRSSTSSFITVFETRDPNQYDVNYQVQQRWVNTVNNSEWILYAYSIVAEVKTAIWLPITATGEGIIQFLEGNSGGEVGPNVSDTINVVGDGTTVNIVGDPSTNTLTVSANTAVPILFEADSGSATPSSNTLTISGGTTGLTTSGSGSTIDLTGTLIVEHGGTGDISFTDYAPICGGTASTAALQSASTGFNNSGFVLTSTGTSSLPTWQAAGSANAFTSINNQVFTTSGTYTPTAGMKYCIIECIGGGGAGGGAQSASVSQISAGSGGGAGEYARAVFSAITIGVTQTITIGAGGTGSSGTSGNAGGNSSVGSLISSFGGSGGLTIPATSAGSAFSPGALGGTGGSSSGEQGDEIRSSGNHGGAALITTGGSLGISGTGGDSQYGSGGREVGASDGENGLGFGSGGSGAESSNDGPFSGGSGASGIITIAEYI